MPLRALALAPVFALCAAQSACQGAPAPAAAVLPSAPPSRGAAPATQAPPSILAFARGAQQLFIGAGDIASCEETADEATADMLDRVVAVHAGATVFTAGDNVYPDGAAEEFAACYTPNWGRHRARTLPTIGNHDVRTDNGRPYHDYFGANAGTYGEAWAAHTVGTWENRRPELQLRSGRLLAGGTPGPLADRTAHGARGGTR
jgi:hypothetical protein